MVEVTRNSFKCIRNWTFNSDGELIDLCSYLTIGKTYLLSYNPPASDYVINIIDDKRNAHDMNKDMFIDVIQETREEKLNQLGI